MSKVMFQIGEAVELMGITPKTIRYYHEIGLLEAPNPDETICQLLQQHAHRRSEKATSSYSL